MDTTSEFFDALGLDNQRRALIIGEVAQAHDGSLGTAHAFVDAVADAGADAVKFQTHIADAESTPREPWRVRFSPQDETRFEYWRRMEFTEPQWAGLRDHASERGILFLSTPFSFEAVDLLQSLGVPAWKVSSGETGNTPMLQRMAATGKPVMISTGLSDLAEIDSAVATVRSAGALPVVMQCTTSYPTAPEDIGLNMLEEFRGRYECPVGLSDHSATIYPGLAAIALGADVVEVHLTLSRQMYGPDVVASLTSDELTMLCEGASWIHRMHSSPADKATIPASAEDLRRVFSKSLVPSADLAVGHVLSEEDLALKKPGTGLPAEWLAAVVGRTLTRDVARDELLAGDDLDPPVEP